MSIQALAMKTHLVFQHSWSSCQTSLPMTNSPVISYQLFLFETRPHVALTDFTLDTWLRMALKTADPLPPPLKRWDYRWASTLDLSRCRAQKHAASSAPSSALEGASSFENPFASVFLTAHTAPALRAKAHQLGSGAAGTCQPSRVLCCPQDAVPMGA